jgi:hypothetical protein
MSDRRGSQTSNQPEHHRSQTDDLEFLIYDHRIAVEGFEMRQPAGLGLAAGYQDIQSGPKGN